MKPALETSQLPSSTAPAGQERHVRGAERLPIELSVMIRADGKPPFAIHLRNISALGFMGETLADLPPHSEVTLKLPGIGLRRACIRWRIGSRVGGRFASKIDLAALRSAAPEAFEG